MSDRLFVPPESEVAEHLVGLLEGCDPEVVAHSERSYQFAVAFAAADGVELDDEVLYLGTVLHDVGLAGGARRLPPGEPVLAVTTDLPPRREVAHLERPQHEPAPQERRHARARGVLSGSGGSLAQHR